jgi:hypothetical protein
MAFVLAPALALALTAHAHTLAHWVPAHTCTPLHALDTHLHAPACALDTHIHTHAPCRMTTSTLEAHAHAGRPRARRCLTTSLPMTPTLRSTPLPPSMHRHLANTCPCVHSKTPLHRLCACPCGGPLCMSSTPTITSLFLTFTLLTGHTLACLCTRSLDAHVDVPVLEAHAHLSHTGGPLSHAGGLMVMHWGPTHIGGMCTRWGACVRVGGRTYVLGGVYALGGVHTRWGVRVHVWGCVCVLGHVHSLGGTYMSGAHAYVGGRHACMQMYLLCCSY